MSRLDGELEQLREVSCSALLERLPPPWRLDRAESTRNCLKYRRGKGEIILVTHGGRGWWDPGSTTARGDVFNLVQHLQPGLNFGQVRKLLRDFIGIAPSYPAHERTREHEAPTVSVTERWAKRRPVWRGSPTWRYLTDTRRLPGIVVTASIRHEVLREGPQASAWFAHRDHAGHLTGIEIRGPEYRGFSAGGDKTLFRLPGAVPASRLPVTRLAVTEAPIDAMSLAAIERLRGDTLYLGTAGGMGPHTLEALGQLLEGLAGNPAARVVAAFDADTQGERYTGFLEEMAAKAGVATERLTPPDGWNDWNQVLTRRADA
ncbi:Hypothetical protein HVPorG_03886 (plasmid) [Roseomonas mucosa]|uniref:DUF3991 and TOPRIM domain-containing protein n=1 Tax=Roseomonas mucosa TaxID=207340 RepID=UPI00220A15C5|nr:DUF3991 and TOPRIM domain-containing protein [Roseomonas mucosa]QDJ12257.1 Hypothetical protein HVPorG_03886 [Roseomonas mucosa]